MYSMKQSKAYAVLCGLIVLCILCALFIDGFSQGGIDLETVKPDKAAAALRYMPVYTSLQAESAYESFEIDTAHGGEGYIAVTAKSRLGIKLRVTSPRGTEIVYSVPNTGEVSFYPLSDGSGRYSLQLLRRTDDDPNGTKYERVLEQSIDASLYDEFQPFLRPSTYVWFTGYSYCVNEAARLCAGVSNDNEKIRLIKNYVGEKLKYDESLADSGDQGFIRDPDEILSRGTGVCLDYSVLIAAMLRSQGIPAKVVYGSVSGEEASHAWNMVYTSSRGWFRLDVPSSVSGAADSFISDDANYTDAGWY